MATTLEYNGHRIDLSNEDKVMYPDAGLSKQDVVEYFARIAETMLPHLRDRPISMHRFPDGLKGGGFYHKRVPDYFPDWVDRVRVDSSQGGHEQVVCSDRATLVYLANQGCLVPHVWLSRRPKLWYPDRFIIDLDPPEDNGFGEVVFAARVVRSALEDLGMRPYVMTTGSKGLHVVAPIKPTLHYDELRRIGRCFSRKLARQYPERLTYEMRKNKRQGRVLLDWVRNNYGQTTVAPYSLRVIAGAPVATPLRWHEVTPSLHAQRYQVRNIFRRLAQAGDPWADIDDDAVDLKGLDPQLPQLDESCET